MKKFILLLMLAFSLSLVTAQVLFDGFETGNTQGSTTINGWTQATGPTYTSQYWTANSTLIDYNRTPRTGSWNVTLRYGGEAWLFAPVNLTASTSYTIDLYARQDGATSTNANIGIYYGTAATIAGMVNTILPQTGMIAGDYQKFSGTFTPDATQTYYIGIKGFINYSPWYISLDDVNLQLTPNDPPPTNHVTDFAAGTPTYTSIPLTWTGSIGAQLPAGYLIQAKTVAGSYVPVANGTPVANDADWTNGNAAINVPHVAGANTYTFTGLAVNTAYEFKIWPYTNGGANINFKTDGTIPTVNASTLDPTQPLPYTQNFNSGTSLAAINWTGDMYISSTHGNTGTNGLYRNLFSSVPTSNAVSCPIGPMVANAELDFDYRIVNYSGYPATGTTLSATDKIEVQISTDGGLTFPNTIYTINSSNHVTSNAFASLVVPLDDYSTGNIFVKLLCTWGAGDYYVDIDNVVVRQTPAAGVLTVSPNPVACGNGYVGFNKNVQVSLTNTGVAPFAISLGGITLSDNTHFGLSGLPTLPKTINPGDPAVTFNVVFHPTVTGDLSTNLLINDTRLNSSIVVNGTGVVMPVGEICENPYLATLPLVNYAGTTLGYANDYTSAMFTGLGNTSYVGGLDWVTKFTIPESGWLDVNLTNPTGDTAYYYPGIFLVNTIPSLASPAAVLAQAYASTAPINITDAELTAGDYYLIVDNWPSPATINFVLNMSFQPLPSGPVVAPNLDNPADGAPNMPKAGFPFHFSWNTSGSEPEAYNLYIAAVNDLSASYDADEFFSVATAYDNVASPYTPAFTYAYGAHYVWTVGGYNTAYPDPVFTWPPYEFVIEPDPTNYDYPYLEPFDAIALGEMPAHWTIFDTSGGWQAADNIGPYSLPYAATIYYNSTLPKDDWMITLPMYMEAGTTYNVSFMVKGEGWASVPEALALHVGNAPTVAAMTANAPLYDNNALSFADWTNIMVPFIPATDGIYYFGWHAYSPADLDFIAVDDVMIYIPEDIDLAATGISGDGAGFVDSPVSTTVTVSNLGTSGQSSYTVYVKNAATNAILDQFTETVELASLASRDHTLSWTPTVAGPMSIYGEVVCPGDANLANNTTGTMDVTVFTASTVIAYVGDPATTWVTTAYPFNMYWEDFVAETIYLGSEMMMTSGTINAIAYYNNFDAAHTKPVQIWMKNTTANDVATDWLPWDGYVLVFDGDLVCPAGVNEILIPITPFTYTGGNLAIRTSRTWQGEWTSSKQWFVTENLGYLNRTRYYQEDSDLVDHTAPMGGTVTSYVPNTLFILDPATPISSLAAPDITVSLAGTNVSVDWTAIPYAYSYQVYTSNDPYAFGAVPEYTVYTNNLTLTPGVDDVREFFKITSATYRTDYRGSVANRPALAAKTKTLRSADTIAVPKVRQRLSK